MQPLALPEHMAKPVAQAVAQPAAQPLAAESRHSGKPSAVADSKALVLPAPLQSSNASQDSKNACVLNAQGVAAADGAQPMDLDKSDSLFTGKQPKPTQAALCIATMHIKPMWPHALCECSFMPMLACTSA